MMAGASTSVHPSGDVPDEQQPFSTPQLMLHVAGIRHGSLPASPCAGLDEALPIVCGDPLRFQPGTNRLDPLRGRVFLCAGVEAAAAARFPTFMKRAALRPLGMERTVPDQADGVAQSVGRASHAQAALRVSNTWNSRPNASGNRRLNRTDPGVHTTANRMPKLWSFCRISPAAPELRSKKFEGRFRGYSSARCTFEDRHTSTRRAVSMGRGMTVSFGRPSTTRTPSSSTTARPIRRL
jgi:CubicO group peptidase (beta-lactamase class C family)